MIVNNFDFLNKDYLSDTHAIADNIFMDICEKYPYMRNNIAVFIDHLKKNDKSIYTKEMKDNFIKKGIICYIPYIDYENDNKLSYFFTKKCIGLYNDQSQINSIIASSNTITEKRIESENEYYYSLQCDNIDLKIIDIKTKKPILFEMKIDINREPNRVLVKIFIRPDFNYSMEIPSIEIICSNISNTYNDLDNILNSLDKNEVKHNTHFELIVDKIELDSYIFNNKKEVIELFLDYLSDYLGFFIQYDFNENKCMYDKNILINLVNIFENNVI